MKVLLITLAATLAACGASSQQPTPDQTDSNEYALDGGADEDAGDAGCVHLTFSYENGNLTGHYRSVCSASR